MDRFYLKIESEFINRNLFCFPIDQVKAIAIYTENKKQCSVQVISVHELTVLSTSNADKNTNVQNK